jgi:hypothetical protein
MRFQRRNFSGRGRPRPGVMNGLETKYAEHLKSLKRENHILEYWFEGIKFKLADKTYYTPDFLILRPDMVLEVHEVKGFWLDDARVKIKVAAEKFPFQFKGIKLSNRGWEIEEF